MGPQRSGIVGAVTITNRTRKLLWGRAGNRCAICRKELVRSEANQGFDSVVGDECHIVASSPKGPRGSDRGDRPGDRYDNLILLCPNDHTRVDEHPGLWPVERLVAAKARHEQWVASRLGTDLAEADLTQETGTRLLVRLRTGSELLNVVAGAHLYSFQTDDPHTQDEADLLGSFCQLLQDYGDLAEEMEAGWRVQTGFDLSRRLEEMEAAGFVVLGARRLSEKRYRGVRGPWELADVAVLRSDNPGIRSSDGSSPANSRPRDEGLG
jgi:hypothetical protein